MNLLKVMKLLNRGHVKRLLSTNTHPRIASANCFHHKLIVPRKPFVRVFKLIPQMIIFKFFVDAPGIFSARLIPSFPLLAPTIQQRVSNFFLPGIPAVILEWINYVVRHHGMWPAGYLFTTSLPPCVLQQSSSYVIQSFQR